MKIAIDALSASIGGGLTYILNIVPNIAKLGPQHHYFLYVWDRTKPILELHERNLTVVPVKLPRPRLVSRLVYQQVVLPISLRRTGTDLLFSTSDVISFFASCKIVLLNQNPNPFSNLYPKLSRQHLRLKTIHILFRLSARKASKVLFVSEHARQTVSNQLRISKEKTAYVYHGVDRIFSNEFDATTDSEALHQFGLDHQYVLSVSNVYKYKNFVRLIETFKITLNKCNISHDLVIVGKPIEPDYYSQMLRKVNSLGLKGRIHFINSLPYQNLPALYKNASLFVFPSYLETFGIPLIEAMASGVPVVASNASCIPEICQDAVLYFDPFNVNDMAEKMEQALFDEKLREKLISRGLERAKDFSWEKTARETLALLEEAASKVRTPST
ncbi:MAG: glycosyltransferase family 4 protein [Chloroflexi bacterium]|nr:glycosyltransferase family 4 protein [Chloroflexota bacterium]